MADAVVNLRRNTEQVHEASRQIGAFLASIHERDASLRGGEGRAAPPGAAARRAAAPSSDEDSEEEREIAEAKDELRRLGEQQARGPAAARPHRAFAGGCQSSARDADSKRCRSVGEDRAPIKHVVARRLWLHGEAVRGDDD